MKAITSILAIVAAIVFLASPANAVPLYAATGTGGGTGTFGTIDTATGAFTVIGDINDAAGNNYRVTGLAVDPNSGILYGSTSNNSTAAGSLLTINPITGQATVVGSYGFSGQTMADLTFGPGGLLYGWLEASADDLHTINLLTGAATSVGNSGLSTYGAGLAANAAGTIFFSGNGNDGDLDTVNSGTGATTTVATLSGGPASSGAPISALAFDPTGTLYGINMEFGGSPAYLITIDTATGAISSVGQTRDRVDAIAFGIVNVPEPATGLLFGLGVLALSRRRKS